MKVLVSSQGRTLDAPLDPRFGRASCFLLVDTETLDYSVVENTQNLHLPQGAGIQAGKTAAAAGAEAVLTGHCGPKAFDVLQAAGITVVVGASGRVIDAVQHYKNGRLKKAASPNVEGHWV
ncbi:NifB/NifX family molybdenum-iron cluster-binding protein [Desulfobotulus sp.]|jgi:predicted Fe-Mo cluster-binding NifX family protein|uniref:NifB/NifX family molybdenum-iron cluster-binding protein n=1 Tax=Desulfobotulus sp. TaxID=1940337 RepID=UPI002A360C4E|nr:NifB/NifX family molybdenum-iron cluster-binding protein [Desulfobotulus sp.]MDY0163988.1 NifB/NifX family molybdenum-iron cluster-binding protein [Desulfobotulus sp.]